MFFSFILSLYFFLPFLVFYRLAAVINYQTLAIMSKHAFTFSMEAEFCFKMLFLSKVIFFLVRVLSLSNFCLASNTY